MNTKDKIIATLKAERDRLAALVDRLPKTADGVTMIPGMDVHLLCRDGGIKLRSIQSVWSEGCAVGMTYWPAYRVFSTREAAEAAGGTECDSIV